MKTVSENDVLVVLTKLRDLRAWVIAKNIDPWATRQALLMALEMDTKAALEHGITQMQLDQFDNFVKHDMVNWLKNL